jgi:hypothetical protein
MHSGSGIGRGNSLNCWRTVASDLGIDPDATLTQPTDASESGTTKEHA